MTTWIAESIIDLVFICLYFLLFLLNIFNVIKHGFARDAGYILLLVVSVCTVLTLTRNLIAVKIAGNTMTVVYNTGASSSVSVDVWGTILSQLGFVPLLYATLSFISRWVHNWAGRDPSLTGHLALIRLFRLLIMAAFILGLLGGIWTAPDSTNLATAYKLRQAGDVLFIVNTLGLFLFTMFLSSKSTSRDQKFDPVILQIYIVMPIMFMRSIYATVQAFMSSPSKPGHNIWVYLALLLIPDFISLLIYTLFGFVVPKAAPRDTTVYTDTESGAKDEMSPQEGGYVGGPAYQEPASSNVGNNYSQQGGRRGRRQRRRGGPLHMLYYAIMDRRGE